jgi:hypothetical protein
MELRPEFLPTVVPAARVRELAREIERIEELLQRGERAAAEAAIAAFNEDTGHDYGPYHFLGYAGSRSAEEFAREAARAACPRVPGITREELVEIVRRILEAGPDVHFYVLLFDSNVAHPRATDLIFHPPAELEDASPDQIVDAALAYRAIAL